MSKEALIKIVQDMIEYPGIRSLFSHAPYEFTMGYDLSAEERIALNALPKDYFSLIAGEKDFQVKKSTRIYKIEQPNLPSEVLLISMPFASINQPSAALGLLKSSLKQKGINSHIAYLSLDFAKRVGVNEYQQFFMKSPKASLIQEWVFSIALFEKSIESQTEFIHFLINSNPNDNELLWVVEKAQEMQKITLPFINSWLESFDWRRYKVIGFTTTYQQVTASLLLAKKIKEIDPKKIVVFGGACCNGEMGIELHRQFQYLDYVFTGEADIIFPEFLYRLLHNQPIDGIPGIVSRNQGKTISPDDVSTLNYELDLLPYPDYKDYFDQASKLGLMNYITPKVPIESSRGCWWGEKCQCTFCGYNSQGIAYRSKSAKRIFNEVSFLNEIYNCPLEATDSIFNQQYIKDLLPDIVNNRLDLNLFFETKASLTRDELELMQKAGVWRIQPGIESLSTSILKIMRKGTSELQNVRLLKLCAEFGIACNWLFLYGLPGEEKTEYRRMADFVPSLIHLEPPIRCQKIRLERFSPLFNLPDKHGIKNIQPSTTYQYIYPFSIEVLAKLAYYFDFEYSDGRNLDYVEPLIKAVDIWQQRKPYYRLDAIKTDDTLYIWDLRPTSEHPLLAFNGLQRQVLEMCGEGMTIKNISRNLMNCGTEKNNTLDLQCFLDEMCSKNIMFREGQVYLTLAIPFHSKSS